MSKLCINVRMILYMHALPPPMKVILTSKSVSIETL